MKPLSCSVKNIIVRDGCRQIILSMDSNSAPDRIRIRIDTRSLSRIGISRVNIPIFDIYDIPAKKAPLFFLDKQVTK